MESPRQMALIQVRMGSLLDMGAGPLIKGKGLNSGVDGLGIFAICPDLGLNLQYFAQNFLSVLRWLAKRPWKGYHNQGHHDL